MHLTPPREILLRWLLATACLAVLIFFFSPSWGAFSLWARVPEMNGLLEVRRGASVLQQLDHPGTVIADPLHRIIQWRLFFPWLGHALHLPPAVVFAFAPLGCLLVLGQLLTLLRQRSPALRWSDCALAGVALGGASWFFTSTGWLGYYDSWLALALLLVAFGRSRWAVWLPCVFAPWIDERFLLALPLALLCRQLWRSGDPAAPRPAGWRIALVPGVLALGFLGIRFLLLAGHTGDGATLSSYFARQPFLDAPLSRVLLGVWDGLRSGWIFVGAALLLLRRARLRPGAARDRSAALLATAVGAMVLLGLASAQDYSRSMTMLFPVAVLGLLLAARDQVPWLSPTLRFAAAAALLLPAHHVMNDRVNPIYYLYHELAALHSPPPAAMPELYELRAIHAMERGEYERAHEDLTLAIKLSRNPTSPARQRGILAASQGRWAEALIDFSAMVQFDPENPDAWFMRAQARLALGESARAVADIDRALALAPAGWSRRPDVTRFLAKVNQAR